MNFDRDVCSVDESSFVQTFAECGHVGCIPVRISGVDEADHGHWTLPPCHHRPRRRSAKSRDEVAPFHSMTSSAREKRMRNGKAKRVRGRKVYHKLDFGRLLDRDVGRIRPM
jgi:hypothetical protein